MARYAADKESPLPTWLEGDSLAPFCPAEPERVVAAISAANITADDYVVDLGCGDGRIVVAAAQAGARRCLGIEIEPDVADLARLAVRDAGLDQTVQILTGDVRSAPLGPVTCVFVYLLPDATNEMAGVYRKCLDAGARIISMWWDIPELGKPASEADRVFVYSKASRAT